MNEFEITFWKEPFNDKDSFVKETETYLTAAHVTKTSLDGKDIYRIKLKDIGLDSLYGEFSIEYENGFWKTTDKDSAELNLLKWNIIGNLHFLHK